MDNIYQFDLSAVEALKGRSKAAFQADPKFFKRIKISPSAIMKMMMHAQSGVDKGRKSAKGLPVEVMGKLIGIPDVHDERGIVIIDAKPLNADGMETQVSMSEEAILYDSTSQDHREPLRHEAEVGWYHSHPFESGENESMTFFSGTDVTNHTNFQNMFDTYVGIVIDPQKSVSAGYPVIEAYCAYFNGRDNDREMPDGTPVRQDGNNKADKDVAIKRWGNYWNKYYRLEHKFFASSLTKRAISTIQNVFMYESTLSKAVTTEQEAIDEKQSSVHKSIASDGKSAKLALSSDRNVVKNSSTLGQLQALHSYGQLVRKSLVEDEKP